MNDIEYGAAVERMLFDALDALKRADTDPWVAMFADDGVMEFPYAPPGNPAKLGSKQEIAGYMKSYPDHISIKKVERCGVYHSPGTMVVEFRSEGVAVPTGNPFIMEYVGVITHEGGKIKNYRDYWNPLVALQAMGHVDALLGSTSEAAR